MNYLVFVFGAIYEMFGYMYNPPYHHDEAELSDVLFYFHGLFMISGIIVMVVYYPRMVNRPRILWVAIAAGVVITMLGYSIITRDTGKIVELVGVLGLCVGFVKFIPQLMLNVERASTVGWSVTGVWLDFLGQCFAFVEFLLQHLDKRDEVIKSLHKTGRFLLIITLVSFDIIFLFHHYVLYSPKDHELENAVNNSDDSLIRSAKRVQEEKIRLRNSRDRV